MAFVGRTKAMTMIKLSNYAKKMGVCYMTAYRWCKKGLITNAIETKNGRFYVREDEEPAKAKPDGETVVYCRVSSPQNKSNLEGQAQRVCAFCAAKGWTVSRVVKEIGSGLNDNRKLLCKLLGDARVARIVVEHKDRLTRFGFNYLKLLFPGEIIVINEAAESRDDIMQDFISVITSFCSRIYGLRRSRRQTEKIIKKLELEAASQKC